MAAIKPAAGPLGRVALALAALGAVGLAGAQAQTQVQTQAAASRAQEPGALFSDALFAPPPTAADYAQHYRWPEECLAAVQRVRDSARWGTIHTTGDPQRWRELLAREDPPRQPGLTAAGATALRCAARFPVATLTDTVDLLFLQETFYAAPDSVLEAVIARRLALAPADTSQQGRAKTLLGAIRFALDDARPARMAWVERQLAALEHLGGAAHQVRFLGYTQLVNFAQSMGDTTAADRYQAARAAAWDASPERTDPRQAAFYRFLLLREQRRRALTRGEVVEPEAVFQARLRAAVQGTTLTAADSATIAAAAVAPPLQAAFWFRRTDSTTPRPTRGKVGLVVFLEAECSISCYTTAAQLRALHERFGEALEITLVAHTHGYFRNHPPPTPAEEARHLARYYFEHLQLPGALAVDVTPSTTLPAPDRRRVDQAPPPTIAAYLSQKVLHPATTSTFGLSTEHRADAQVLFVDHQGQVVSSNDFIRPNVIATYLARAAGKS